MAPACGLANLRGTDRSLGFSLHFGFFHLTMPGMKSSDHDADPVRRNAAFATTRWSLVLAAGERENSSSPQALAELCQSYWYPLYAYVRRGIDDVHEAQDLTQAFFQQFLDCW